MGFTIGQLANEAEINVETIRYYERRGLIRQPVKPVTGYRFYNDEILHKLHFIKRAKRLGFKLDEIENLFALSEDCCTDVQLLAEQKLNQIRSRIRDLQRLEGVLENLLGQCSSSAKMTHCPIIDALLTSS